MGQLKGPVFVTGGSGYLGRNVLRRLAADGVPARALARSDGAAAVVADLGAEPVRGDLDDEVALETGMKGCEVVFHCAAWTGQWDPDGAAWHINVEGTEHVLDAARRAGVPRVVHVGTEAVYVRGDPLVNLDETVPLPERTVGPYPRTKNAAERRVREANGDGLETVVVRPRLIWGRDDTSMLAEIEQATRDGVMMWVGGGEQLTSTCHVDNAVEGMLLAATKGTPGGVYFLTDGPPVPVRTFLSALLESRGLTPPTRTVPTWAAWAAGAVCEALWGFLPLPGEPPITRMAIGLIGVEVTVNDALARAELGYEPIVDREEGLADLREEALS